MIRRDYADALRGFALIGICIVNVPFMAWGLLPFPEPASFWDSVARALTVGAFEAKFFILFSFLFGFGLALQARAEAAGTLPTGAYPRRLWGLLILGIAHGSLLFPGDILTGYALLGAIVWRLRAASEAVLRRTAFMGWLFALPAFGVLDWLSQTGGVPTPEDAATLLAAYRGGWGDILTQRVADWGLVALLVLPLYNGPMALAAFALGVIAGRKNLLADPSSVQDFCRRYGAVVWGGAVVGNGIAVAGLLLGADRLPISLPALALGGPCLALLYAGGLARLSGTWVYRRLAKAGQVSLSLYLGQSLAVNGVIHGLDLFARLSPAVCLILAVAVATGLILLAGPWLSAFRYGPAEWLLRCWTYRAWLPFRR